MEPMLIVFICSQFAWGIVAFVLVGLYFRAVRNCSISRFGGSPLGQILGELIYYCNNVWPTYVLDGGEKWPVNGSLNYCTIMQLNLHCQKLGKWDEIPYVRAFVSLHNKVSSRAGNRLLLQRKEEASKLLSDHKTKESFSARNPGARKSVGGRALPWCPIRLGWRLSATATEFQEDNMAGAADGRDSGYRMVLDQQSEDRGFYGSPFFYEGLQARSADRLLAGSRTSDRVREPVRDAIAVEPPEEKGSATNKKAFARVLGLSHKNKDEMDAAVALSLLNSSKCQAGGKVLNRKHEAMPTEAKRSKRRHLEIWGENRNPSDWKRVDGWPVGLKNVGNTCWFSAVIQSLFQLPELRRLVLSYTVPQNALENCTDEKEKRNAVFMQELQRLFALMMGSNRKFVDPSSALNILKGAFQEAEEEQQQDVSEFTHKLLDWLEDAFQQGVDANSNPENPMVRLFYGTVLTEGVREGKPFSISETFGLYPLQVNGYCNLEECLDGAVVEGDAELLPSNQPVENGQESWFTKLPPVLTFELSRFEFNQSLGQPEKIHNKLEFSDVIYMDKYMYKNKDLVRSKRECIRKLKEEIEVLQQKVEKYVNYDSDPAQVPLLDETSQRDSSVTSPPSSGTGEGSSSPDAAGTLSEDPLCQSPTKNKPLTSSPSSGEAPAKPLPRTVTGEMNVETGPQKLSSETEQDIQDVKNFIANTTRDIGQMYCDPLLSQVPYRLHAVLVHEGQADAGHYWVYIYDQSRQVWLKYNDIYVTESSWEELQSDSYGGSRNASAYCLMYVEDRAPHSHAEATPSESEERLGELEALSDELKHYIQEDNWRFEQEIEEWEEEQARKISQMELSASPASQDFPASQQPPGASYGVCSLLPGHAAMVVEQPSQTTANTTRAYGKSGVGAVWSEATHEKHSQPY